MTSDINIRAFEFVDKIKLIAKERESSNPSGSSKHIQVTDMSDKIIESPIIERTFNHDFSNQKITLNTKEGRFGFDENIYPDFYSFIFELTQIKDIGDLICVNFP